MKKRLEIIPEGWVNGFSIGGAGFCGKANPGVSFNVLEKNRERYGGAITIDQAIKIRKHLAEAIIEALETEPEW